MIEKRKESRLTPLDSNYASCKSTHAELIVYPDFNVALFTQQLGISPTYAQNKGDLIKNTRGITRKSESTYWCLSSEDKVLSRDIRHHLKWLLDQLYEKKFALAQLQRKKGVKMTVNCNWYSSGAGGPTLWPEQMALLAELNLECTFDIYCAD